MMLLWAQGCFCSRCGRRAGGGDYVVKMATVEFRSEKHSERVVIF